MTIDAIAGNVPAVNIHPKPALAAKTDHIEPPKAAAKHDFVEITPTALAKSMKEEGQTPAQIALKMNLPIATVNDYLDIQVPPAATAPVLKKAAPAPLTAATPQPATTGPSAGKAIGKIHGGKVKNP